MKKFLSLILISMLLLSLGACAREEAASVTEAPTVPETTQAPTEAPTEPAPTEPDWQPGTARASYGELTYCTLDVGTEVTVVGEFAEYYVIYGEEADLLVNKRFLRLATEEPFAEKPGYAKYGTEVFDNVDMTGEPITKLGSNAKVQVVEGKDDWLYITWEGGSGYVAADKINDRPIRYGGGGGGGGGGKDGSDVPMGSLSNRGDAPHVELLGVYCGPEQTVLEETKAVVLVPDTKAFLTVMLRDDSVKVVTVSEESCELYLSGFYATAPRWMIRLEEDEAYESWTGYARYGSALFTTYQMRTSLRTLSTNTQLTVLDELPDCYVVQVGEDIGYMKLDYVSRSRYKSGGGGGGGSSGGGWTPPAM